jgi:hypothetical protein
MVDNAVQESMPYGHLDMFLSPRGVGEGKCAR